MHALPSWVSWATEQSTLQHKKHPRKATRNGSSQDAPVTITQPHTHTCTDQIVARELVCTNWLHANLRAPPSVENTRPEYGRNSPNQSIVLIPCLCALAAVSLAHRHGTQIAPVVSVSFPTRNFHGAAFSAGGLAPHELMTCLLRTCWTLIRHTLCNQVGGSWIQKGW